MPKFLIAGSIHGNLKSLSNAVYKLLEKNNKFDFILATGLYGESQESDLADFIEGKYEFPIPLYFVEKTSIHLPSSSESISERKTLCHNIHYLGLYGYLSLDGLHIAYLSSESALKTPIKAIIEDIQSHTSALDVLLTPDWPDCFPSVLPPAEMTAYESLVDSSVSFSHQLLSEMNLSFNPRYIFSRSSFFYNRVTFLSSNQSLVTRFISLSPVGVTGPNTKSLHALALQESVTSLSAEALLQNKESALPCPFMPSEKRKRDPSPARESFEEREGEERRVEVDRKRRRKEETFNYINNRHIAFIAGLPYQNLDANKFIDTIKNIIPAHRICIVRQKGTTHAQNATSGKAFVEVLSPEDLQKLLSYHQQIEVNRRRLAILEYDGVLDPFGFSHHNIYYTEDEEEMKEIKERNAKAIQFDFTPKTDCWFCLSNPQAQKHLIIDINQHCYVALAKGGLCKENMLVVPINHYPCLRIDESEEASEEMLKTSFQLREYFIKEKGMECVIFERYIPMHVSKTQHMQIQVVPVSLQEATWCDEAIVEGCEKAGCVLEFLGNNLSAQEVRKVLGERVDGSGNDSYLYFALPGANTASGRLLKHFLYVRKRESRKEGDFDINLVRKILALDVFRNEGLVDWKKCSLAVDVEAGVAEGLRKHFRAWKKK